MAVNFHTHQEENLVRSFQNVFDKSSRVLILVFQETESFGYHTPLNGSAKFNQISVVVGGVSNGPIQFKSARKIWP